MAVTAPLTSAWIGEPGTALVTGATGGIGSAVVRLLTEQGWTVVATDRDPTGGDRLPSGCRYVVGDITERDTHERFVAAATEIGDNRWALVHCAGASRAGNYLLEDPDSWEELRTVNLDAGFHLVTRVARDMVASRIHGSIVLVASIAYLTGGSSPGYGMAKAGLVTMGYGLAQALGPHSINVNSVAPGVVESPMTRQHQTEAEFDAFRVEQATRIPLRRIGQPDDVAGVVAFLASDHARYVNGAVVPVTGGIELLASPQYAPATARA
jgi:3-oxoacyl-[acyl-carrier protein] reductase